MSAHETSIFLPVSASERTRELIAAVLRARAEPTKCIEYFHEGAIFNMIGRVHDYSFSGVYRGRQQILDLLRRIDGEVELSEHKILNLVVDGDNAALRRSVVVRHHGTSAVTRLLIGNLVKLRDSKIAEAYEYADTAWLKRLSGEGD